MGKHRLSLEVPDTLNGCIMLVSDSSTYDEFIPVSCPQLLISIPGFNNSFDINVSKDFSAKFTACDLGIQTDQCGFEFNDLPDGIYVLKYSVSPNDKVYVEYNHLRITKAQLKLKELWCKADLENCESSPERKKKIENLRRITDYLTAAKSYVEFCRQAKKGLDLYKEAMRLLDKANCLNCK